MGRNHRGTVTGKTFRLSVCLKRFFSDERARCYITADRGLHFRWLAARLRRLFALQGHFCLVSRGHLLPPDEPVGLLDPDDLLEVIPKHYKIFPDTSDSDSNEGSEIIYDLFDDSEKGKPENTVPKQKLVTENNHNHDKICNAPFKSKDISCPEQNSTESQVFQEVKISMIQNGENQNIDKENLKELEYEKLEELKRKALELLDQCSIPPKRKRKRVRRRKPLAADQEPDDPADTEDITDGPDRPQQNSHMATADRNNSLERSLSPLQAGAAILRNNMEHSRTARIVHSLS